MYFVLLVLLVIFMIVAIVTLLIPSIYNLIIGGFSKLFFRDKTMDIKPHCNHQVRVLTLEDGRFQDDILYKLKKG